MTQLPNVLWLVSDHQIHVNGPQGGDSHPLQRFLKQVGTEFAEARTVLPVCSPARASMLTGLYPHAHGLTENDGRFGGRDGLSHSDWMVHHHLKQVGYRCAWFGKWHLDNFRSANDYGFEGWSLPGYGYPYATEAYKQYLKRQGLSEPVVRVETPGESGDLPGTEIYLCDEADWFNYEAGSASICGNVRTHEAYFVSDLAAQWMSQLNHEPFFLRVDTWGPHPPYLIGQDQQQTGNAQEISLPGSFYNQLEHRPTHHRDYRDEWQKCLGFDERDWKLLYLRARQQAQLVESALLELVRRIDFSNTLVIYTSDHGDAVGTNGGTANKGGLMTESTLRVPLLMAGPNISAGSQNHALVSNLDIPATLLDLTRGHKKNLHSRSLLPMMSGTPFHCGWLAQHNGLHVHLPQRAWYENSWKLVVQADGFLELYNLINDPDELNNLATSMSHVEIKEKMIQNMKRKMLEIDDDFRFFGQE